jgi:excisionase family DNA binding protein
MNMTVIFNEMVPPTLKVREVARLLNIHTDTVRRWSDLGILRAYRIGIRGDRRFKGEDIENFLGEVNNESSNPEIEKMVKILC